MASLDVDNTDCLCTNKKRGLQRSSKKQRHSSECPRRQYKCPHCKEKGEYQERTTTHLEVCPQIKVPCPNDGCNTRLLRSTLPAHRATCEYEVVKCKYEPIGCTTEITRNHIEKHEKDNQSMHLEAAFDTIVELKEKQVKMQDFIDDFVLNLHTSANPEITGGINFTLANFDSLKASNAPCRSPPFYSHQGGYRMMTFVFANGVKGGKGSHVSIMHCIKDDKEKDWPLPFNGVVHTRLLNALENKNHYLFSSAFVDEEAEEEDEESRTIGGPFSESVRYVYGNYEFIAHSDLGYNPTTNCQYLKNDCLFFQVRFTFNTPWHPMVRSNLPEV